jgi:lipid A disaccharide synthetase
MLTIQGKHLKEEGLQSIINIRASLNLGLSEVLKQLFLILYL